MGLCTRIGNYMSRQRHQRLKGEGGGGVDLIELSSGTATQAAGVEGG